MGSMLSFTNVNILNLAKYYTVELKVGFSRKLLQVLQSLRSVESGSKGTAEHGGSNS